jgi:diguanylate cyclase (GGDEF)-like protein
MKKSQLYAIGGFLFGWGAPVGAVALRYFALGHGMEPLRFLDNDWAQNTFFYWYMMVGTCLVFTLIGYLLGRNQDAEDLRNFQKVDQAIHDSLTGLASHSHMHELFAVEFKRHLDSRQPISCLLIELDRFREINETYGHPLGDVLLKDFAQMVRVSIRQGDTAARYGGEEFLCILPDCDEKNAKATAERIRLGAEKLSFPMGKTPVKITASIGAVTVHDMHQADYRFMIAEVDKNLSKAKEEGRNRTVQSVYFDKVTIGR